MVTAIVGMLLAGFGGRLARAQRERAAARRGAAGGHGGGMSDAAESPDEYHLLLDREEVPVAASAVRLLLADEAGEADIRAIARQVLALLEAPADERGLVTLPLAPPQMKITHSAVRLLINDLQRGQAASARSSGGSSGSSPTST